MMSWRLVVVESPYAGDIEANLEYARACLADCIRRGEAPMASHLLYTQPGVLDDNNPGERMKGIFAGFAWGEKAELTAVYVDRGISHGMEMGVEEARRKGRIVEYRRLEPVVTEGMKAAQKGG